MKRLIALILYSFCTVFSVLAHGSENPNDTYIYRSKCPVGDVPPGYSVPFPGGLIPGMGGSWVPRSSDGKGEFWKDRWSFAQCNCTSYVAHKLNELWGSSGPQFSNGYYSRDRWGNAYEWLNAAINSGIGVTGATDNFTWDDSSGGSYNAVFKGDVALWKKSTKKPVGHVAVVGDSQKDMPTKGVKCVKFTDYNIVANEYRETDWVCKNTPGHDFPDYFLHIDKDHAYCHDHSDQCPNFLYAGSGSTAGGVKGGGIGGSSDLFNLKVNEFWVKDLAHNVDLTSEADTVRTGEALQVRSQVKAVNGDTHDHMRNGKDTIELDFYAREDFGEWYFLKREYIQATNLPSGATHTEHVDYTVPTGVTEVSFKVKIDAEDEAAEANEGDNWSEIQTFQVNNFPTYDITILSASITTGQPVSPGSPMGAKFTIQNIGTATPPMDLRSCYDMNGPGTGGAWQNIASDKSDGGTLIPGQIFTEEIHALVPAPSVPGTYILRVTGNCDSGVPETDYTNNSFFSTFEVRYALPDFIVASFGLREGTSIKSGTRVHPYCTVKNVGGPSPRSIELAYYINADVYRDNDTVEASELCAGCQKTEEVQNDDIKLGDKGTRTYRCCVDYKGVVAESNESNNCATMSFTVR